MKEQNLNLIITPLHPFTPRQGQILELRPNDYSYKEIGQRLKIRFGTIANHISGNASLSSEKSRLGILGIIEKFTHKRPVCNNLITPLIGDVLFYEDKLPNHKFITKGNSPLLKRRLPGPGD